MKLGKTVGNTDRMIRYVVAAVLAVAGFLLTFPMNIVAYLVALILLVTGYTKTCALYSILGINTLEKGKKTK